MFSIFLDFPACIFLAFAYDRSLLSFRIFRALHALFLAVRAHTRRVQPKKHKKASCRCETALFTKNTQCGQHRFGRERFCLDPQGLGHDVMRIDYKFPHFHSALPFAFPFRFRPLQRNFAAFLSRSLRIGSAVDLHFAYIVPYLASVLSLF